MGYDLELPYSSEDVKIKALTVLVGRLIVSECRLGKCPEPGLKTVPFNPQLPVILASSADPDQTPRSAASDLSLHCLQISQFRFYI